MPPRGGLIVSCALAVAWPLAVSACGQQTRSAPPATAAVPLREQMRLPPSPPESKYITQWLICGPCQMAAEPVPRDARPAEGDEIRQPDGSAVKWTKYDSDIDTLYFEMALGHKPAGKAVAYAYTTVTRPAAGKALLYLRGRAVLTVYCNGRPVPGTENVKYSDKEGFRLPVELEAGVNGVLVRVERSGREWGFAMRVDEPDLGEGACWPMSPRLAVSKTGQLTISTDTGADPPAERVSVAVLAPAGAVVASAQGDRGEDVTVDAASWPDGPYEVRIIARTYDGYPKAYWLPWYKGDWAARVVEILNECDALPVDSDDPVVLRKQLAGRLLLYRLGGDPRTGQVDIDPTFMPDVFSAIMEYCEAEPPAGGAAGAGGHYRLAWRDEVDGSPQYAWAYLPADFDPAKQYPLVVYLHGYRSGNPEYVRYGPQFVRHNPLAERNDVILVGPHGRGNTQYRGIGEADVMRAISEAFKTFNIDRDRVYLYGQSMGGDGTWHLGTRHAGLFAAIAPVFGGWDYHAVMSDAEIAELPRHRRLQLERQSSFARAECLLNTPVFVQHGDVDDRVDVANSRYVVRMLQRWGYDIRYWEHPGVGHDSAGMADPLIPWFLCHKLKRNPRHVRVRAESLECASAHWLHLEQQENPLEAMYAEAWIVDSHTIKVNSENVLQIRLSPSSRLFDLDSPVRIVWNGRSIEYVPYSSLSRHITLRAEGYAPGPLVKKASYPTPRAIVVGTASADPSAKAACAQVAEQMRQEWVEWQHVEPRVLLDTEIKGEQLRKYSLTLIGGPDENLITHRITREAPVRRLPLEIAPGRVTICGRTFEAKDAAVRLRYRYPLNPDIRVETLAGTSTAGLLLAGELDDEMDFTIETAGGEDNARRVVACGMFDYNWRLDDRYVIVGD